MAERVSKSKAPNAATFDSRRPGDARFPEPIDAPFVLLDRGLPASSQLIQAMTGAPDVVRLGAAADALQVLGDAIRRASPRASSVHLFSHGRPGVLLLSAGQVSLDTLTRDAYGIAGLRRALAGRPLVLYGCSVGRGAAGQRFVEALSFALDAPVHASSTPTGAAGRGGDWTLDVAVGMSPGDLPPLLDAERAAAWPGLLAVDVTSDAGDDSANTLQAAAAAEDQIVRFSNLGAGATITLAASPEFTNPAATNFSFTGTTTSLTIGGSDIVAASHLYFSISAGQTLTLNSGVSFSGTPRILQTAGGGTIALNGSVSGTNKIWVLGGTTAEIGTTTSAPLIDILGNSTVRFTTGGSYTSNIEIKDTATIDTGVNNVSISGNVTDDGTNVLAKTGTGTLTLSGSNTATGSMTVSQGTLSVAADGNLSAGALTLNGGTLAVTGATTIDNAIALGASHGTLNTTADVTFSGVISGTGNLTKTGANTATLSGTNTYSGTTTVSDGTVSVAADSNLGTGALTLNGGTLAVTGATTIDNAITLGASHGTLNTTADVTFSGVVSGTGNLTKTGASTATLSGTNTYSGTTTVSDGTVSVAADSNLGTGALTLNGGTLAVTGATTIDNAISLGASNGTVNVTGATTLSGDITGTGSLTKTGTSTVTLSGTNTYSGGTTISAGTLQVSGGNALADAGAVTVSSGATLDLNDTNETVGSLTGSGTINIGTGTLTLTDSASTDFSGTISGTGTIAGGGTYTVASGATLGGTSTFSTAVTVQSGGTIAPGNSPGKISTGNLTLASGSTASMEINGTTAGTLYDQIAVTGTVTISNATLNATVGYTSAVGDSYILIDNDGTDAVTGTFSGLAEGATLTIGGARFTISYAAGTGNDVVLTRVATPAPAPIVDNVTSGSDGADHLIGGSTADHIKAFGGDDTVSANAGNDTISGGAGEDLLSGQDGADLIFGNEDDDTLWGNYGADTLWAGDGNDLLYGNQDADSLKGEAGDDTVYGGKDADLLDGGAGNDSLFGNLGADTLSGGVGADSLIGGYGSDLLSGGDGADLIYGNQDADILYGDIGQDTLYGGKDADHLDGGAGDDSLYGNLGADTLSGGAGADTLVGGDGNDLFRFADGDGADVITDFVVGQDVIGVSTDINGTGVTNADEMLARITSDGSGNAVLDLAGGNSVTLIGVAPPELDAASFLIG
ncbi:DUF4347 domain-containing protein [Nisaea nitritireducens]|uniref:DUF4347 domain-containing protein n=1 Tax=Nisaea nitritireducens TaxID=568392 RepID=UPI001868B319|nr:DUF4347 domain-containing protein [Nisaea nitritireducens]